jgi:D-xylose transport system ATP-binding protein
LADRGLAVILISHNLTDVFAVADEIGVLYLGQMVAQFDVKSVNSNQVVELITGGRSGDLGLKRPEDTASAPVTGNDAGGQS